jgi:fucose permease
MVIGIFLTSVGSGLMISRTGRYKVFPIVGAAITLVSMVLLARLEPDTPYWLFSVYIFALGAGLGFTMQTVVVAVQNDVALRDLGASTSAVTFFRSMGGAFGTALFGAVLTSRMQHYLAETLPAEAAGQVGGSLGDMSAIAALPDPVRSTVLDAFMASIQDLFLVAVPFVAVALVVAFLIPEKPLKTREDAMAEGAEQFEGQVPMALE